MLTLEFCYATINSVIVMNNYQQNHICCSLEHLNNIHIYLSSIGFDKCEPSFSNISNRDFHLIHYVKSGKGTFTIDGSTYTLSEGDAFYIPPYTDGFYSADPDDPWEYYYFSFNGAFVPELLKKTVFFGRNYVSKINKHEVADIIYDTALTIHQKECLEFFGIERLFQILQFFLIDTETKTKKSNSVVLVETAKNLIQSDFPSSLKISKIAKQLNINRSYLYKIFIEQTGISPLEYITNLRIQQAKILLSTTNYPLGIIAEQVGYNNYSVFFSTFCGKTFLSPTEFRLLQLHSKATVELNTNSTIRIFKTLDECYTLDSKAISELPISMDSYYKNEPIKSHYAKELMFDGIEYMFFAYEFEDVPSAKKYFFESTSKIRFSPNETKDFKIVSADNKTELTVWKDKMAFRLIGKDPIHFNMFRHYIGTIFNSTVYDQ